MLWSFNSFKLSLFRGRLGGGDTRRCWVGVGMVTCAERRRQGVDPVLARQEARIWAAGDRIRWRKRLEKAAKEGGGGCEQPWSVKEG